VTISSITATRPYCIEHLEKEIGTQKLSLFSSPAPDKYETNRSLAEKQRNGCLVFQWEKINEENGAKVYYAQVWLPEAKQPILNERDGYGSSLERQSKVNVALSAFDERDNLVSLVQETDDPLVAAEARFDGENFF